MKKYKVIISAAAILLSLSACEKEKPNPETPDEPNPGGETPTVEETLFSISAAKVFDGETAAYTAVFSESDDLVVNSYKSSSVTLKDSGAEFVMDKEIEPPYLAVAPASAVDASSFNLSEKSFRLRLTGSRKPLGVSGTFNVADVPMAAYSSESTSISLGHLMTFLSINFKGGPDPIKTVTLQKNGMKNGLSGTWIANIKSNGDVEWNTEAVIDPFVYDCIDSGIPAGSPVVIAVPAYNFDEGLQVTVVDNEERTQTYEIEAENSNFSGKAGKIIPIEFDFTPVAADEMPIKTAEDFLAFIKLANSEGIEEGITVKLMADIELDAPESIVGKDGVFDGRFDGGKHTITVRNANHALFRNVHGLVQNLTIDGDFGPEKGWIGVLVDTLYSGGLIKNCTNKASISGTSTEEEHVLVGGGLVRLIFGGGNIENCVNEGTITLEPKMISNYTICYFGGIVGVINNTEDVALRNCVNKGTITVNPDNSSASYNIDVPGFGGIVGWVRSGSANVLLDNCDNFADITINKDKTTVDGRASAVCVGGIIGIGAPYGIGYHALSTPSATNGLDITMRECDNTGNLRNMAISLNQSTQTHLKSFTGGLAGSLLGKESKRISVENCTVTDCTLTSYDEIGLSERPGFCTVVGGAIGFGGYVDIKDCTFKAMLGNGKRQSSAVAGVLGFAMKPFSVKDSKVVTRGYFNRVPGFKGNRACVAVVPTKHSNDNVKPLGDVNGSVISGCQLGGGLFISTETYVNTNTSDLSEFCTTELFTSLANAEANAVCGQGFTTNTGVTLSDNIPWDRE